MNETNSRAIVAQSRMILEAASELGKVVERARDGGKVYGIFDDLAPGDSIFVMGHRYHWLGIVKSVSGDGKALVMDNVHQINYDEVNSPGPNLFPLGDSWRLPDTSIGGAIQPISGRPPEYQRLWKVTLDAWIAQKATVRS